MKLWHTAILVLVVYALGATYPGPFQALRSKVGL